MQSFDGDASGAARSAPEDDAPTAQHVSAGEDGRARSRHRWAVDAAVIFGLAGLAVTQPLLDLFGRNPTFFVAGNYGRRQVVAFAVVIAVVPALVVFLATALPGLISRRVAAVAHGVGVAFLAGLLGLVLCRSLGLDPVLLALPVALAFGIGIAWAEARYAVARRYLSWLALGNVLFLVLFLFTSPASELLAGTVYADAGAVRVPALEGPVTVVVLDEFPLAAILRPDGTINEVRYPNLAALAGESSWFRNASAEWPTTYLSVPEILSGVRSEEEDLPTFQDHPRNLVTLFGTGYPVNTYEVVTQLCPPDTCGQKPPSPLRQALSDASVVYQHRVLPEAMREDLPAVDQGWGDFGTDAATEAPAAPSAPPVTTASGEPGSHGPPGIGARVRQRPARPGRRHPSSDAARAGRRIGERDPRAVAPPSLRPDAVGGDERQHLAALRHAQARPAQPRARLRRALRHAGDAGGGRRPDHR